MRTTAKALLCLFMLTFSINTTDSGVKLYKKMGVRDYVNKFKYIAMSEMKRTNIPASITLAQGILESRSGNSYLTRRSKNHFGIKCHSNWKGKRAYAKDDTKRDCFRIYASDKQSFIDHSNFLTGNSRYSKLFELGSLNYKSWAEGLREAGYATDKKYARNIVAIINRYKLHQYDRSAKYKWIDPIDYGGIKTVFLAHDASIWEIGEIYNVSNKKLCLYNNIEGTEPIPAHTPVFLESPKRKRTTYLLSDGSVNVRAASVGNTATLYGLNGLEIAKKTKKEKAKKVLKAKRKNVAKVKQVKVKVEQKRSEEAAKIVDNSAASGKLGKDFQPEVAKSTKVLKPIGNFTLIKKKTTKPPKRAKTFTVKHKVKRHETLYRLSKRYNTTVKAIAKRNGLKGNAIKVGETLLIKVNDTNLH